jgi:hypothetical protein
MAASMEMRSISEAFTFRVRMAGTGPGIDVSKARINGEGVQIRLPATE